MGNSCLIRVAGTSLSPVIDNPGFSLVYTTSATGALGADINAIAVAVGQALTSAPAGGVHPLTAYWAGAISRAANSGSCAGYDLTGHLDGSPHGSPQSTVPFTPTAAISATSGLPEGVACCVTLQASYGTDVEFGPLASIPTPPDEVADFGAASTHTGHVRPRARDRGRFYFGPLDVTCTTWEATTNRTILKPSFVTDVVKTVKAIFQVVPASANVWNLGVWSRRNASVKILQQCSVDDRPDYQRRRADAGVTRTIQTLP